MKQVIRTKMDRARVLKAVQECRAEPVMVVSIEPYQPKHSDAQRRRHWALIDKIADYMPPHMDGVWNDPDVWHEYFMRRYVGVVSHEMPDGSVITRYKSSKGLGKIDYAALDEKILAEMATEYGFSFEVEAV